jgi:hypothetical protein
MRFAAPCEPSTLFAEGEPSQAVKQAITAIFQKAAAPLANGVFVEAEFGSHRLAG